MSDTLKSQVEALALMRARLLLGEWSHFGLGPGGSQLIVKAIAREFAAPLQDLAEALRKASNPATLDYGEIQAALDKWGLGERKGGTR